MVVISCGGRYSCRSCRACRIALSIPFSIPTFSTNKKGRIRRERHIPLQKGIVPSLRSLDCLQTSNTEEREGEGEKALHNSYYQMYHVTCERAVKGNFGWDKRISGCKTSWEENKSIEQGIKRFSILRWTRSTAQGTNCALEKGSTEHNGKIHWKTILTTSNEQKHLMLRIHTAHWQRCWNQFSKYKRVIKA